jgi:RNA polymerase sigma factor for flagellar operon FliA
MTSVAAGQEAGLWAQWRIHSDPAAREQLAGHYTSFARMLAAIYYSKHYRDETEFADYYQFACVGLMEALDGFDPDLGVQFKTYATRRVQGAIIEGLERMTEKRQQIGARMRLRTQRLEGLTAASVPGACPSTTSRVPAQVLAFVAEVGLGLALSWLLEGTGMIEGDARAEIIPFYRSVELRQLRERLLALVEALPAQERTVVRGHYLQEQQFEEIAVHLGLTRGRVSQIHRQAIDRLRGAMHAERFIDVFL